MTYIDSSMLSISLRVELECVENGQEYRVPYCSQKRFRKLEILGELLQQLPRTVQEQ